MTERPVVLLNAIFLLEGILGKLMKPRVETLLGRNNSHGNVSLMKATKKTTFVGKIAVGQVSRGKKNPDLVVDFCFYNLRWVLVVMFC